MESKLKAAAMDSVGELLAGYPHLPTTPIKQEPQLTDWISGDLKPVRDGMYQRNYGDGSNLLYCRFQDGIWYLGKADLSFAAGQTSISTWQKELWRGLSSNPNEVQP